MILALVWLAFAAVNALWLRRRLAVLQRLNDVHWDALVTLDILAGFAIFNALHLPGLLAERPRAGATISAFAGRYAANGAGWAAKLAAGIDALFFILTSEHDHCEKAAGL